MVNALTGGSWVRLFISWWIRFSRLDLTNLSDNLTQYCVTSNFFFKVWRRNFINCFDKWKETVTSLSERGACKNDCCETNNFHHELTLSCIVSSLFLFFFTSLHDYTIILFIKLINSASTFGIVAEYEMLWSPTNLCVLDQFLSIVLDGKHKRLTGSET